MPKSTMPLFCPRCRKPRALDDEFAKPACPACGETLAVQGYCPVCDDYWALAVDTPCPKHDLPLEAAPPLPEGVPGQADCRWVTVGRFTDTQAAQAPRIRLEAEGIPTFLEGERMGSRAMYAVATGGTKLKVPEDMAGDARIILSQTWSATAAALDIEELPDDEPDPADTDHPFDSRAALRSGVLMFLIVGLPVLLALVQLLRLMAVRP